MLRKECDLSSLRVEKSRYLGCYASMVTWMHMARTTIQLDEETRNMLREIKDERKAKSYAEVIRLLLREAKSMNLRERGSLPKLESFQREKLDRLDR